MTRLCHLPHYLICRVSDFVPVYRNNYQERLQEAAQRALENDVLVHDLLQAMSSVTRNRYNLEVFLSLARLTGHQNRVLLGMKEIEERLESAREAALRGNSQNAARSMAAAYGIAGALIDERKSTFAELQKVWEKSRFPKGREVDGKKFVHILDDVKDHWADRRADLSYMIAPEESIGLEKWREDLKALITAYQKQNQLPESKLEDLLEGRRNKTFVLRSQCERGIANSASSPRSLHSWSQ